MTEAHLQQRFGELCAEDLPRPGAGNTAERHDRIFAAGREDLSLAKLVEAHWDAIAILREAGRESVAGAKYAVWASEIPGKPLTLHDGCLRGTKHFCSGAGLVDRALITAGDTIVEVDLRVSSTCIIADESGWRTDAFRMTHTAALTFQDCPTVATIGDAGWYVNRCGFWQGACGPAAAWAGGAAGLLDYAINHPRQDAHSMAHLAAMHASVWSMQSCLKAAADQFDGDPATNAMITALTVRHTVEQACTEVLQRFGRMLGPAPLVKDAEVIRRVAELELFLRQSHAERDLEALGRALLQPTQ